MGPHQPVEDSGAVTAHGRVAVKGEEHVTLSAELAHKALGLAPLGEGEQVSAARGPEATPAAPHPQGWERGAVAHGGSPTSQSSLMCLAKSVWVSVSEQPRRPVCASSRSWME